MTYAAVSSSGGAEPRGSREKLRPTFLAMAIASVTMATGACAQSDQPRRHADQVATPQTLWARISAAKPGETVLLSAGDYGPLEIEKKFAAPGLIIQPEPGAKASFSSIKIGGSEGITIKGVDVDIHDAQYGVSVGVSSNITLANLKVHSPTNGGPSAMMLRHVSNVVVQDCEIQSVSFGINFLESDHIKILRNNFNNLQVDAIRGSSSYVDVIGNHASGFHPQEGDHPDFIQFWGASAGEAGPPKGAVIKDNVFERGDGDVVQGIFMESNDDVVISGNALLGTMYNGIAIAGVHQALIEDNFVQGYDDMGTRIITRGESSEVTVRNNVAQAVVTYNDDGKPNPGYKEEHNRSIHSAKVGDTRALQAWLANRAAH